MRKMLGDSVAVYLKTSKSDIPDIVGLLIEVTDDSLYVQEGARVFIVPKDNVNYCTANSLPASDRVLLEGQQREGQVVEPVASVPPQPKELKVYVGREQVASIPVPPTFDLSSWHNGIMQIVLGNPDVSSILSHETLKSVEYNPGEVYIEVNTPERIPEQGGSQPQDQNSFSMGNSNPITQVLSPLQMVTRLQNASKRGKKGVTKQEEVVEETGAEQDSNMPEETGQE